MRTGRIVLRRTEPASQTRADQTSGEQDYSSGFRSRERATLESKVVDDESAVLDACGVKYDSIESAGELDSREGASMASTTGTEELGTNQGRSTIGEDRQVVRGICRDVEPDAGIKTRKPRVRVRASSSRAPDENRKIRSDSGDARACPDICKPPTKQFGEGHTLTAVAAVDSAVRSGLEIN